MTRQVSAREAFLPAFQQQGAGQNAAAVAIYRQLLAHASDHLREQ